MKIKKEGKNPVYKFPVLNVRYTFMVPFMGIVDALTMASFYVHPSTEGNLFMKLFYLFFGLVGLGFAVWGAFWRTTADGKTIRVRPVFGRSRELAYSDLKKVEVHKKKKSDTMVSYHLIDRDGKLFVKIYPVMRESSTLFERLQRLNFPMEEVRG